MTQHSVYVVELSVHQGPLHSVYVVEFRPQYIIDYQMRDLTLTTNEDLDRAGSGADLLN